MQVVLVIHNVRSCYNVGSLLRSADGFAITKVYLSGFTPYPLKENDCRLPHIAAKVNRQIAKTALGAEQHVDWEYRRDASKLLAELKNEGYLVLGLELSERATNLADFSTQLPVALVVGNELEGLSEDLLKTCNQIVNIPMLGKKESLNVSVAGAVAMYHLQQIVPRLDR